MRNWLLALWLFCATGSAQAEEFTVRIIIVLDGDTVMAVRHCGKSGQETADKQLVPGCEHKHPFKIRLAEIDAPEKGQPGGAESEESLGSLVSKKHVNADAVTVDKYGRLVAHLTLNGKSINEEQVRRGMAWEYSSYHRNKDYRALQNAARRARRGLWAQRNPTPPWEWRKLHATNMPAEVLSPPSGGPDLGAGGFTCGSKRQCAQMRSCAEARFYFTQCGRKSLDGNGDGVPCESLCKQ